MLYNLAWRKVFLISIVWQITQADTEWGLLNFETLKSCGCETLETNTPGKHSITDPDYFSEVSISSRATSA